MSLRENLLLLLYIYSKNMPLYPVRVVVIEE